MRPLPLWLLAAALCTVRGEAILVADGHTGGLLGGWMQGKWIDSQTAAKLGKQGDTYTLADSSGASRQAAGAPRPIEGPCGDSWEVPLPDLAADALAVRGAAKVRTPVVLPSTTRIYQIAFRQVLDQNSIRSAVKIDQLWQVDLNGDGVNEVLASLYNAAKPESTVNQPGDYSLIAVRLLDAQKRVRTLIPVIERYGRGNEDISRLRLGPIVDLNGDGLAEIVVRGSYTKGKFTHVYELQKGKLVRVLECTCGG